MSECEIFLSKLADKDELYAEISEKLSPCSNISDIAEFFCKLTSPLKIKLFVSNENVHNDDLNNIIGCFRTCTENNDISLEITEEEFLNIMDGEDRITSKIKPRSLIHRDGDLHPTVHIWIIKRMDMGIYVLLQKRAPEKDTHPGCYDVSAAGHVSQGDEFRDTAVREVYEELGLTVLPENLDFIGTKKRCFSEKTDNGKITDNELSAIYLYRHEIDIDKLTLQTSEVSEVYWAEIDELLSVMDKGNFKHCISAEELRMIKKAVF